jgi:hypothetical protein
MSQPGGREEAMRIKASWAAAVLIAALALALVFTGCKQGVSKEERIDMFLEDLNKDPRPNSIRYNFSEACTDYGTITGAQFEIHFPVDSIPYSLSIGNYDPNPVTGTISGKTGGGFGNDPLAIAFTMTKDGDDWYILKLVLDVNTVVVE